MSFAGLVMACWLGIAAIAFLAISGLSRLAARGDVEADLRIVGDAELRILVGGRESSEHASWETRLAMLGMPSAGAAWVSCEGSTPGAHGYTGAMRGAHGAFTGTSYTT